MFESVWGPACGKNGIINIKQILALLDAHKKSVRDWPGLRHVNIIKTSERGYCIIAEWADMDALAKARPHMIATLDTFRDTLEDLGAGLGVTDPVAGPVVLEVK